MKINGTPSPDVQATTSAKVRDAVAPDAVQAPKTATTTPAKRRDSVEISDAGRALADAGAPADRVGEIRQRILNGAYDSAAVVDTVARRILQRGDI